MGDRRQTSRGAKAHRQYGVLPWRRAADGELQVLLITSRRAQRWVVPKGWPIKGLSPGKTATREAFEEAGLEGRCAALAFGAYHYVKRSTGTTPREVVVEIFPMEVEKEHERWPEMNERRKMWASPVVAAALIDEPQLKEMILAFDPAASVHDNLAEPGTGADLDLDLR